MQMTRYMTPLNLSAVLVHLRLVLRLLGLLLLPSLVVALIFREYWQAAIFGGMAAATLVQGLVALPSPRPELELKEAPVVTALAYLLFSLLGYLVFLAVGMGPFKGLLHIQSTISTGGFSPHSDNIAHFP